MHRSIKYLALFGGVIALSACLPSEPEPSADDQSGQIRVIDGDTFEISGERIRLFGIDAPEQDQTCTSAEGKTWACGAWVTNTVRSTYQDQEATCETIDTDRYGRKVARCFVKGTDVAQQLVQDGLAFAYRRYSMDYDADERRAAELNTGLHASRVQPPAQFRQTRAEGRSPPDPACTIKGNISSAGTRIFHSPGQRDYESTVVSPNKGEKWFCTAQQAREAGWRAARR